ncbi:T9SS type A sorting domain-containing protein [Fulvivirga sp. M361]|uniref:T9SS type A sorting domain-containing protein n=1 Tax=Fulvivirga sp. M361 TaxID=2594266 RepID=UPI00117B5794|nr:T9SS type A sorting domain-containing protein [Fulvivirga sp. M361]TRX61210.1 T9SS type A sorting domain-containing protein [Fulvivirga sp. M361]
MKKNYRLKSLMALFFLIIGSQVGAQDTLTVDSNSGEIGLLNDLINNDTTATGDRATAVYRLKRGQTYVLSGGLENVGGYHLNIVAEEGDGERPRIVPGVISGGESDRPFRARGDLTLKGLYITGRDELGTLNPRRRIIRLSAPDIRVEVDDCHLDQDGQAAFRTDDSGIKLYLTNSIVSNIGQPRNTLNGRVLDDRGSNLDTVIYENNTFYNISHNLCNDRGGWIKYARVNQNTIVHVGNRLFDFDETQTGIFTNNLVINAGYLGNDADTIVNDAFLLKFDTLSEQSISELPDVEQTFTYTNNNIYLDSAIIKSYPTIEEIRAGTYPEADSTVRPNDILSPSTALFAGEAQIATNITEFVNFSDGPPLDDLVKIIDQFYRDPNPADDKLNVDNWDISDEPFSFRYSDFTQSASSSINGGQLGALSWELILSGKSGLEQSLNEARALLENAEAGGNLGQYRKDAIDALTSAVTTAEGVLENQLAPDDEVTEAKTVLDQAIANFNGQLITSTDGDVDQNIFIYPNPASEYIFFKNKNDVSFEMWSVSGIFIGKGKIEPNAKLSLRDLKTGTYILRVRDTNDKLQTYKLIKQ